jgi:hypothetical protein
MRQLELTTFGILVDSLLQAYQLLLHECARHHRAIVNACEFIG